MAGGIQDLEEGSDSEDEVEYEEEVNAEPHYQSAKSGVKSGGIFSMFR